MYYEVVCTVGSYLVQFVFASIFILCSVRMLAARILRQASARYTDANAKRPMVVQGVTAGSITALGDVIMQQMERRHAKVHLRAKRSACSLLRQADEACACLNYPRAPHAHLARTRRALGAHSARTRRAPHARITRTSRAPHTHASHTPHHTLARPISRSRLWWLLVLIPGAARRRACTDAAHRQLPSPRLRPSLLALAALPRAYVFFLSFPKCRRPMSAISHKLIPQVPCGYRLLAPSSQR